MSMDERFKDEEWAPMVGFPNYYISTHGRATHYDEPLTPHEYNKYGHSEYRMYKNKRQYAKGVHVLMAEAFIENPNNYPIVRHLDDNPRNNYIENLAWGTRKDNTQDSIRNGTFVFRYHYFTKEEIERSNETNRTPVIAIEKTTGNRLAFKSQAEAARQLHVSQGNIGMVLTGRRNHTGGYTFEYADKEADND